MRSRNIPWSDIYIDCYRFLFSTMLQQRRDINSLEFYIRMLQFKISLPTFNCLTFALWSAVYNCIVIFIEHYATLCLSLCKYVQESNHESYCTILLNICIFNNTVRLDETWATWKSRGAASRRRLCPIAWNEACHSRLTSSSYIFSDMVSFIILK